MPGYTASPNPPTNPPGAPHPAASDVQMLDVSNEELELQFNVFPSPSHHSTSMHIEDNDGESSSLYGGNGDNTINSHDDSSNNDNNMEFGEGGGHTDQLLETVFRRPSRPMPATTDLDTGSEASDDEEELQPPNSPSKDSGHMAPSIGQASEHLNLILNSLLTTAGPHSDNHPFIVKFGGRAGEVVPVAPKHVGYEGYSHVLGVGDASVSEWAPFSTQTEWEIARWAKLRGPGSTAFSELLKIDGVSEIPSSDSIFSNPLSGC